MGTCEEKSENPEAFGEEESSRRVLVGLAVWLGITILVSGLLDLFAKGISLGFTMPILNAPATLSMVLYYVAIYNGGNLHRRRRLKGTGFRKTFQRRVFDGGCRFRCTVP